MRRTPKVRAVVGLCLLLTAGAALAEPSSGDPASTSKPPTPLDVEPATPDEIPARRLTISHFGVGTLNPLGLEWDIKGGMQYRLFKSDDILLHDTFTFLGGQLRVNPVYSALGVVVESQPLAVINLRAKAEAIGFYGILGVLQSWQSPYANFSDTAQNARTAAGDYYATYGFHAAIEPTLQAAVGPIAVQNRFALEYWNMRLRSGDTVWYDAGPDHMLPGKGLTLQDELSLVYLSKTLTAGLDFRYAAPLFTAAQFQPNEDPKGVDQSNMRLGVIAAYTFFDNGYTAFNKPTVFALVQWWLKHPYRTGQDVSQLIPFFAVGFTFQQDFVF